MARGWESKSVEQQQEEAKSSATKKSAPLTPEQIAEQQRRRGLELSRQHLLEQLERATKPNHRKMLESALADLESKLSSD